MIGQPARNPQNIGWVQVFVTQEGRFFVDLPLMDLNEIIQGRLILAFFHDPDAIEAITNDTYDIKKAMGFLTWGGNGFELRLVPTGDLGIYVKRQDGIDIRLALPGGIREVQTAVMA